MIADEITYIYAMAMEDRFYTELDDQLNAAWLQAAGQPGTAHLQGRILLLSGQLTAAYGRYRRAMEAGQDREAGKACHQMVAIEEEAIRLFKPHGLRIEIQTRLRD